MPYSAACDREVIIRRNVLQIVLLLFNHVEGIWYRPRLFFFSLPLAACMCVSVRERGREREVKGLRNERKKRRYTARLNGEEEKRQ